MTRDQTLALEAWLEERFQPFRTVSPVGKEYLAYPSFVVGNNSLLRGDPNAYHTVLVDDIKIRIHQFPARQNNFDSTTGSYPVVYEVVEPDESYQKLVELTKEIAEMPDAGTVVLRALSEALNADQLAFLGENLFGSERNPL